MTNTKVQDKNLGGRPCELNQDVADKICTQIMEGKSLRTIVKDKDMPSMSSVHRWLLDEKHKWFWEQYAKARAVQAESMFDELLEIADDTSRDYTENKQGDTVPNYEIVGRSRLRVDTRKWYLSKLAPKKYGDKLQEPEKPNKNAVDQILEDVEGKTEDIPENDGK